jgi:hypothetical protein
LLVIPSNDYTTWQWVSRMQHLLAQCMFLLCWEMVFLHGNIFWCIFVGMQPHQRDVTQLLAAAVQACHDLVHPFVMPPVFCVEHLACMACPDMNLYWVCGNKPQRNCLHGLWHWPLPTAGELMESLGKL